MAIDLLKTVEQGGCSSKISASLLESALKGIKSKSDKRLIVDTKTHDDGGVFLLNDDYALIQTVDFFPPVCSDPYDFGQIAASNALSDVFAMGGEVLTALNIVMFPVSKMDIDILKQILEGGLSKVEEAKGVVAGGHTIQDEIIKYGMSVTGWVHPKKVITNNNAKEGDLLILTKPIGTGIIVAGKKVGEAEEQIYNGAVNSMKALNQHASHLMRKFEIKSATDITGFGLLGHSLNMAKMSNVSFKIYAEKVPLLKGAFELTEIGCIPGAAFKNLEYAKSRCHFSKDLSYSLKMMFLDAQTSGGILMSVPPEISKNILLELKEQYEDASIIGEVVKSSEKIIYVEN